MDPWYKVATPRKEVREGRSFNPDEFAIALEQVIAGTAPEDYRDPEKFFSRTCFTRALREHAGMVLQRLTGKTEGAAPVLTLITQFGGGKTHTLTALYHLAKNGNKASSYSGVAELVQAAGIAAVPQAKVGVFVGNAWDPQDGRETPWIDIARQIAGDQGVACLGPAAKTTPPGTEAIGRLFDAAGGVVLILFDEVLNFLNRHRGMADAFHAFIQNLTVATTGTTHAAAVISLPRSQVEMTDSDQQWQDRITKVVRRVARDLIANDESEISEVIRRRLFEDWETIAYGRTLPKFMPIGALKNARNCPLSGQPWIPPPPKLKLASTYGIASRFAIPFTPQRFRFSNASGKPFPSTNRPRGTLAMLAQWVSWTFREGYEQARREPVITLGSAPLEVENFRDVILGQLEEPRLSSAISADIAGEQSHARALDADTKGPLRNIHRRVGTTILFESSGEQIDKVAHLPELRFALGEPEIDTTSIDNAAFNRGESATAAPSSGKGSIDTVAPRSHSFFTKVRMIGLVSVVSHVDR
jgi:hypothetical protein